MEKRGIGIRVRPDQIHFVVVEETKDDIIIKVIDKLNVPKALNRPDQLKFIRSTMLDILEESQVRLACIRVTESNAQNSDIGRISIEAVIQELLASSTVERYCTGQISNISSKLGFGREMFKKYVEDGVVYAKIDEWQKSSKFEREAILSALCSLKLEI